MKKWLFLIVVFILFSYFFIEHKPNKAVNHKLIEVNDRTNEREITISNNQIYTGNLLLINKQYPVHPDAEASEVVNLSQHERLIQGFGLMDNSIQLSTDMVNKFSTMVEAARKEGVSHFIVNSGYRDNEKQNELYEQLGAEIAMPAGYSEHNLGLSIDIGSTLGKMAQAPEGRWLEQNAWKYGFILRYPPDKTDITGIQHEPWHFRYVGLPHSAIMQEHGFVLEQYLDFLKEQKSITVTLDRQLYEVSYFSISKNNSITVPVKDDYEISGNNMDGIIMTSWNDDAAQEEGDGQ